MRGVALLNHDFLCHFLADGYPGLLHLDDDVAAHRIDDRHHPADDEAQILQMLFDFRLSADSLDDVFLAGIRTVSGMENTFFF